MSKPQVDADHFSTMDNAIGLIVEVREVGKHAKFLRTVIEVDSVVDFQNRKIKCTGRMYAHLKLKSDDFPSTGDRLYLPYDFVDIPEHRNPHLFDFRRYAYFNGILHQCFTDDWWFIERNKGGVVRRIQDLLKRSINEYIKDPDNRAILMAITLGSRTAMSNELRRAFEDTGAIHVLAISGLHVGILAGVFLFLLEWRFLQRSIWMRCILIVLSLCFIWFFVLLSGASPSVQRAAVMFSIFLLTKLISKPTNTYNVLAAAGLCILLFNPLLLFHVGFQFSFLAVVSIVYFFPIINRFLPRQKFLIVRYFQNLVVVSFAAQLLIIPASIYYFHKVSLVSSISSLVAIPAIFVSLYGMAFLLLCSVYFEMVGEFIAQVLELNLNFLRKSLFIIQDWPCAYVDELYLDPFQLCGLYGSILAFIVIRNRTKLGMYLLIMSFYWNFTYNTYLSAQLDRQISVVSYEVRQGTLIDVFMGHYCFEYRSAEVTEKDIFYQTTKSRLSRGVTETISLNEYVHSEARIEFELTGKKLVLLDNFELTDRLNVDYLFLLNRSKISDEVLNDSNIRLLFFDETIDTLQYDGISYLSTRSFFELP